jgi:hypothetical protein
MEDGKEKKKKKKNWQNTKQIVRGEKMIEESLSFPPDWGRYSWP